jgi:hypothetical protein
MCSDAKIELPTDIIQILFKYYKSFIIIDQEIATAIDILWAEDAIQYVFKSRAQLHLPITDSSAYFWENIHRIGQIYIYMHQCLI